jgi:hypothetical protein
VLVVPRYKLTNIFSVLVSSGLAPGVARGPPVGQRWAN